MSTRSSVRWHPAFAGQRIFRTPRGPGARPHPGPAAHSPPGVPQHPRPLMAPMRSSLSPKQPLPRPFLWRPLWRRPGGSCSSRAQPARGRASARASRASRGPEPPPPPLRSFSRSFSRSAASGGPAAAAAAAADPREACEKERVRAPPAPAIPVSAGDPP